MKYLLYARGGSRAQALEMARAEHPSNAGDLWFQRAYGWVLYDHVKNLVDSYEESSFQPRVWTHS